MDLDDSFTERLLQRAKARKEYMNEKKTDLSVGKKRAALVEEHQVNSDGSLKESPKRQCVEVSQTAYSSYDKENVETLQENTTDEFVPYHSASKTRGLAALKKKFLDGDSDNSNVSEQQVNKCKTYVYSTNTSDLCINQKQKSRFANLAANINQWEDDTRTPTLSSKNVTSTNTAKSQIPLTTSESSTKSTFSMKLYYTNNESCDTVNFGKHGEGNSLGTPYSVSLLGNGALATVPPPPKGNIAVGSVKSKWEKLQAWDQAVKATLETPTTAKSPAQNISKAADKRIQHDLIPAQDSDMVEYSDDESIDENDFAENYNDFKSDDGTSKMETDFSPVKQVKCQEKLEQPMKFETFKKPKLPEVQKINANVDPAELPLSARKALFEKALMNGTPKINEDVVDFKLSVAQRAAMFEKASNVTSGARKANFNEPKHLALSNIDKFEKRNTDDISRSPIKKVQSSTKINFHELKASPVKKSVSETMTPVLSPVKNVGNHTRLIQQKLMENSGSNWQERQNAKMVEERKQEISSLVNHWEKLSSSSSTENNSETERVPLAFAEKVSSESDTLQDAAETDEEYDPNDVDDEEDFNEEAHANNSNINYESDYDDNCEQDEDSSSKKTETDENESYVKETETESLKSTEENFNNERNSDLSTNGSSHNTRSATSSLSYTGLSYTDDSSHVSGSHSSSSSSSARFLDFASSKTEDVFHTTTEKRENKNPEINLLRTVSAYRREKQETKLTPVRTVVRREKVSSPESPPDTDLTEIIQKRLKELQDEILRQQIVISQTSQALNLCSATAEFSGSTEQVEGERLLLIATQKRQACLNEISRMKTCGAKGENIADGTGTLTITDLQLPLKREFIASQLEGRGNDTVHYFLCLIRHGAQVIVTQMMSTDDKTSDGTLNFTNHIQLRNLPADFSVVFEVYALQTKKEFLPHEKKYHIKRENSKKRLTPKGKKIDGKLPAISSPGGPSAVRSPSFGVVGFTRFTLHNCNKRTFTLDKVPFTSPLEGVLRVQLQLHAEHKVMLKGFLTFYEDVADRGALYRRWCALDGSYISYWLYPEDEQKKEPIGTIDLRKCVTGIVKSVPSLECARPHTFKLVTVRPQKKGDKDTLISRTINTLTTTKYLLTADTKDERMLWCNKINEALTNVRKWDPEALRPVETFQI